jgi:hypothetical protein
MDSMSFARDLLLSSVRRLDFCEKNACGLGSVTYGVVWVRDGGWTINQIRHIYPSYEVQLGYHFAAKAGRAQPCHCFGPCGCVIVISSPNISRSLFLEGFVFLENKVQSGASPSMMVFLVNYLRRENMKGPLASIAR